MIAGNSGLGGYIAQVWENLGNGTFANLNVPLTGVAECSVALGDYDNDGYLDILIAGLDNALSPICQVWHNQGNGTFALDGNVSLPGISGCSVAWADFNNDGKLDILMTGTDMNGNPLTQVWQNAGNGTFAKVNSGLPPLIAGAVAVADFNNDGNTDILLTGYDTNYNAVAQVWINRGNGTFTNLNAGLTQLAGGGVAVGDYDNDGNVDLLLTGIDNNGNVLSQLWRNQGNLTFSNVNAALPPVYSGAVAWGDFDNDGWPDIAITGSDVNNNPLCQVWRNAGNGAFTNINAGLTAVGNSSAAWGDYDNDGRLDLLTTGASSIGSLCSKIWHNLSAATNTPPSQPTGLAATATATGAILSWIASTDTFAPSRALSYNLRLGTTPGGFNVVAPSANAATGFRRLPQQGNLAEGLSTSLILPPGMYYAAIQAIDPSFAGSVFSTEYSFSLGALVATAPATQVSYNSAYFNGTVNPRGINAVAYFQWGTTTNYTSTSVSQDLGNGNGSVAFTLPLLTLHSGTTYHYRIAASDAYGVSYGADQSFTTTALNPPVISAFTNITTAMNTPTPAIPFTVYDATISATSLVVTASSSDNSLVPSANLVLGGSGTNRTLTITPGTGLQGNAAITVTVSAASATTTASFILTVGATQGTGTFSGPVNAAGGYAVGSSVGVTTSVNVIVAGGTTNQLQFTGGILTGVVPK